MENEDILFLACTRPAMMLGVPFEGFMVNFCGSFIFGLIMGSPLYWLIGIALHFPMRILTGIDHNFFRIGRLWIETKGASIGNDRWGGAVLVAMPAVKRYRSIKEVTGYV
jgi:type IV secretion system protein VirB3